MVILVKIGVYGTEAKKMIGFYEICPNIRLTRRLEEGFNAHIFLLSPLSYICRDKVGRFPSMNLFQPKGRFQIINIAKGTTDPRVEFILAK